MWTMSWGRNASQPRCKTREGREQTGSVHGHMTLLALTWEEPGYSMVYKTVSFVEKYAKNQEIKIQTKKAPTIGVKVLMWGWDERHS